MYCFLMLWVGFLCAGETILLNGDDASAGQTDSTVPLCLSTSSSASATSGLSDRFLSSAEFTSIVHGVMDSVARKVRHTVLHMRLCNIF